jgi:hypothetical protein
VSEVDSAITRPSSYWNRTIQATARFCWANEGEGNETDEDSLILCFASGGASAQTADAGSAYALPKVCQTVASGMMGHMNTGSGEMSKAACSE